MPSHTEILFACLTKRKQSNEENNEKKGNHLIPGSNWNLEMLVFEERGKPEYPEKNLLEQSREPTTNLLTVSLKDHMSQITACLTSFPCSEFNMSSIS